MQAGDSDRDGLINYDTFTALVDMAAPDATVSTHTHTHTHMHRHAHT